MRSSSRRSTTLRRLPAAVAMVVVATAAVLLTAATAFAEAQPTGTKKENPLEKKTKNYSIPWVGTIVGLAAIVVPVTMATRRKWELPFDDDDDEK